MSQILHLTQFHWDSKRIRLANIPVSSIWSVKLNYLLFMSWNQAAWKKVIISHGIYCLEFTNMLSKGLILSSMRKRKVEVSAVSFNIVSLGQVKHFGRSGNREFYFDSLVWFRNILIKFVLLQMLMSGQST